MTQRILINWDYERPDLLEPFLKLSNEIEFIFLFKFSSKENKKKNALKIIYWHDYKSPYSLLNEVKPDKIIFHDIESFWQVSLNIAAKNSGITTYVLEHGLRGGYEIDIAYKCLNEKKSTLVNNVQEENKLKTLLFYFRSLSFKNLNSIIPFLSFIYYRKKWGLTVGLHKCQFSLRESDYYINFTEYNASYIIKRDKISLEKFLFIGNPSFDKFFSWINENNEVGLEKENFYLLIDSPFVEDINFRMSTTDKVLFYQKLNEFCKRNNSKLIIKLHPKSYQSDYLPEDDNIIYYKDCNTISLILRSRGCFMAHLSTLSPIALYYSPCVFFDAYKDYNVDLTVEKIIPVFDFYSFNSEEIIVKEMTEEYKQLILDKFLYKIDGKATERLNEILINN